MAAILVLKTKTTDSPHSSSPTKARIWTKQVSQLTNICNTTLTEGNRETKRELFFLKKQHWDIRCNKLAEIRTTQIWWWIKKINDLRQHLKLAFLTVRLTDSPSIWRSELIRLPKNISISLKHQLPLTQSNLTEVKQKPLDANRLLPFTNFRPSLENNKTATWRG